MTYLLDSSVCINMLRRGGLSAHDWLRKRRLSDVYLCSVVRGELLVGIRKAPTPRNVRMVSEFIQRFGSFPFDDAAAEMYASIRADLERKGLGIGPHDTQIAAIALMRGATLVTGNPKEFQRIPSLTRLSLEDLATGKTSQ